MGKNKFDVKNNCCIKTNLNIKIKKGGVPSKKLNKKNTKKRECVVSFDRELAKLDLFKVKLVFVKNNKNKIVSI